MITVPRFRRYLMGVSVVFTLLIVTSSQPIGAQEAPCDDLFERYRAAFSACNVMNNNDLCYGQVLLEALPYIERFERPADRTPITAVDEIVALNESGAMLMYLSVGDVDPVKVITVGAIDLIPDAENETSNSFIVSAAQRENVCEATPPGLLVYTETEEQGFININGIDIELGSIAFIALDDPDSVTVTNLEGSVRIRAAGSTQAPAVGDAALIDTTGDEPELVGTPAPSNAVKSGLVEWLAFDPETMPSVLNLNETERSCNFDDVNLPFTQDIETFAAGQECQITFCASANATVSLELEALDRQFDPWLDLRKPDTRLLTFSDDRQANNQNSLLCNQQLPVDGCYTVVARSYRNESFGRFRLTIGGESDCEPPEAICEVDYQYGVNLRTAPEQSATLIKALIQGTRLYPIAQSEDGRWLQVQVARTEQVGWVWSNQETISCGGEVPTATPPPTPGTSTATPTTPGTRKPTPTEPPPEPTPSIPIPEPGPTKSSPFDPP